MIHRHRQLDSGSALDRIIISLDSFSHVTMGLLFAGHVLLTSAAIFMRYVLSYSFMWSTELMRYMVVWMVLIGSAAALRRGEHLRIDFLLERFPRRVKALLLLIQRTAVLLISLGVTVLSVIYANSTWNMISLGLKIPKAAVLFAVPLGLGLFFLMYVLLLIRPSGLGREVRSKVRREERREERREVRREGSRR